MPAIAIQQSVPVSTVTPLSQASQLPLFFAPIPDRSHAPRGNASSDALRHIPFRSGRRAPWAAFPRRAWERSLQSVPVSTVTPPSQASQLPHFFAPIPDRSHAPRGNASSDALRHIPFRSGRRASRAAFPRRAWERSLSLISRFSAPCLPSSVAAAVRTGWAHRRSVRPRPATRQLGRRLRPTRPCRHRATSKAPLSHLHWA